MIGRLSLSVTHVRSAEYKKDLSVKVARSLAHVSSFLQVRVKSILQKTTLISTIYQKNTHIHVTE